MKKPRKKTVKPVVVEGTLEGDNAAAYTALFHQLLEQNVAFSIDSLGATLLILGLAAFRSDPVFSTCVLKARTQPTPK